MSTDSARPRAQSPRARAANGSPHPGPTPPLAPSDLGTEATGDVLFVAGRVTSVSDEELALADAFAVATIEIEDVAPGERAPGRAGASGLEPGDLTVVEVRRHGGRYRLCRVVERSRPAHFPTSGGEHRRLLDEGVGANLVARDVLFSYVRRFFGQRRFLEVDTPAIVPSPGLDLHLDAETAGHRWLITSPEYQMKRLLVGGVPRLFQIAHVFRKGEQGARHNPEFAMLEWYRAFAGMEDVLADTEELVAGAVHALTGGSEVQGPAAVVDVRPPFERLTVAEAFAEHAGIGEDEALAMAETDEDRFFRLLVERVEPGLARRARPVFLTDYPIGQASLARAKPDDPRVCERFELYVAGIELCNGFGELADPVEQRARLERDRRSREVLGKTVYPIDERFVAALEEGMPPSGGNALGLDRLLALCAGEPEIARVMAFPAGWV